MRRMYSEQELTKIIEKVSKDYLDNAIEQGVFDEDIADYVNAYLVVHPVDITALEGLDISVGSLDADGLVTGAEIVEKMSGYSAEIITQYNNWNPIYIGVCKNGNKLTLVVFGSFTISETGIYADVVNLTIPSSIGAKLYPFTIDEDARYLTKQTIDINSSTNAGAAPQNAFAYILKNSDTSLKIGMRNDSLEVGSYFFRIESTFLLSENLYSAE